MATTQQRRAQANRQARQARRRRRRQQAKHAPMRGCTRDQQAVAQRLVAGQVQVATVATWGYLAEFLTFLERLQFYALLGVEGEGFERLIIPIARLLLTYQLKVLLGIPSLHLVPTQLFRERALLLLIGYTTTQLQVGFSDRGHGTHRPLHPQTLAEALDRLTVEEVDEILNASVQRLVQRGCFRHSRGHFALDASDLPCTARYQGAGTKAITERKVTRQREVVEVQRLVHGFKVLLVYEVHRRLIVAAKVVPIEQHESRFTRRLIEQALTNLGPGLLRVLLMDRGFLDGETLWWLWHDQGIAWVIPARTDMRISADARSLAQEAPDGQTIVAAERRGRSHRAADGTTTWPDHVAVVGVADLTSYDAYGDEAHGQQTNRRDFVGHALNAIVVTTWAGVPQPVQDQPVFLTPLSVAQPFAVLDLYDLRSLIENTAFRELKQGWHLTHFPKKTAAAVRAHVVLTLLTFTLVNAFRLVTHRPLAGYGIRRQRAEDARPLIAIFTSAAYAFFRLEELLILLGLIPEVCFEIDPARVRRIALLPAIA